MHHVCFMLLSRSLLVLLCLAFFYFIFFFCQLAWNRLSSPCSCPCPTHTHTHRGACTVNHTQTHTRVPSYTAQIGIGVFGPGWVRPCPRIWPTSADADNANAKRRCCCSCRSCFLIVKLQQKQQLRAAALPRLNVKFTWTPCAQNAFDNPFNEFSIINWHSYSLHCN